MDYHRVLCRYYPEGLFFLSDTKEYSTLEWLYIDKPKPSKEEVEQLYEQCKCELIKEDIEYEEMTKVVDLHEVVQELQKQIDELKSLLTLNGFSV